MRLKLTAVSGSESADIVLTADTTATVGAIADRLRIRHPLPGGGPQARALSVNPGTARERVITSDQTLADAGLRSGDRISLTASDQARGSVGAAAATLNIVEGPGAPSQYTLQRGTNLVGRDRDCDVRFDDPMVSKRHARINVSDVVEIIDDNSANGVVMGGSVVDRAVLQPGTLVTLGDTVVSVTLHSAEASGDDGAGAIAFNRSPRLDPVYDGIELKAPEPPKPQQTQRFPIATLLAPVMMGGMIYAVTRNVTSILFVALSPLMMIGAWFENRIASRKAFEQAQAAFRSALVDLSVQLQYAADLERAGRRSEHPSAPEIEEAVRDLTPLAWTRRPEHESFMTFRLGLGTQLSRNSVELPSRNDTLPDLWRELNDVVGRFSAIDRVPVVADFRLGGNVGIGGPRQQADPLAANVIGQMVGTHSPAELVVAGVAGTDAASWDWLKWLPHVGSDYSPLEVPHLAANPAEANALVSAIEELIGERSQSDTGDARADASPLPAVLLYIGDDAPVERARLVQLAERGPVAGVHVVWQAISLARVPAACRIFLEVDAARGVERAGFVQGGQAVDDLEPERIGSDQAAALARRLSPVVDSGIRADDQSDLPRTVSFLSVAGLELAEQPEFVIDQWRANHSLPAGPGAPKQKRDNSLRALVGQSAAGPLHLDLRTHGPHALVGGTTGAGKSEFLQSWVLGMASMHSPSRVTFLFVDYKGGAAFADCVDLPHCVGLVTDLSPHLVRRALTSLNAELHHRELILNAKRAKDLLELEKRNDPDAPPSLVIVVDEFAALVNEVPEFVDGVVNVAQRGRSLGLHLILATQRPAGVIKDNLRANTNLRVALRMADEADSEDVVGTKLAATFDPGLPGRGVAKTGPGRLTSFQSAYVGGHTSNQRPAPNIEIRDLGFGVGAVWDEPDKQVVALDEGPNDIKRVVENVTAAFDMAKLPAPRRPWLPELSATYRLGQLPTRRTDTELVFGVRDDPRAQAQPEIAFCPDEDGNIAVYGASGSGKSTFLRSLAVAAAMAPARGGPVHVYGVDFGSRGLQMLDALPHVGSIISGDDAERVQRLLRRLRETIDERADRYAKVNAGSVVEYRERAEQPDEPRILVLVDGVGAFRTAYEASSLNTYWEMFQSLAADGRSVGVHFAMSADRPAAVSSSLSSSIQQRLVLRLASEMDYVMVDAPSDGFTETSPPGRGFIEGMEVQVGVLGGDVNVALQAAEITKLAASMERAGIEPAPPVERLSELIALSSLPTSVNGLPTLGVWDETLEPIGFPTAAPFLVTGPPASGRTTAVATMVRSIRATHPSAKLILFGQRRSPLTNALDWDHAAVGPADIDQLALQLESGINDAPPGTFTIVVEAIGELLNTEADMSLQGLLKAARASEQTVIAEGETSTVTGSWPLLQAVKSSRAGIVMQPDQIDGDSVFKTPFPRTSRADYPQGRGLMALGGKAYRIQVALPE